MFVPGGRFIRPQGPVVSFLAILSRIPAPSSSVLISLLTTEAMKRPASSAERRTGSDDEAHRRKKELRTPSPSDNLTEAMERTASSAELCTGRFLTKAELQDEEGHDEGYNSDTTKRANKGGDSDSDSDSSRNPCSSSPDVCLAGPTGLSTPLSTPLMAASSSAGSSTSAGLRVATYKALTEVPLWAAVDSGSGPVCTDNRLTAQPVRPRTCQYCRGAYDGQLIGLPEGNLTTLPCGCHVHMECLPYALGATGREEAKKLATQCHAAVGWGYQYCPFWGGGRTCRLFLGPSGSIQHGEAQVVQCAARADHSEVSALPAGPAAARTGDRSPDIEEEPVPGPPRKRKCP